MSAARLELFSHGDPPGAEPLAGGLAAVHYREAAPSTPDRAVVACTWTTQVPPDAPRRLRVVPDGCADVVFGGPDGPLVFGPRDSWHELELPAGAAFFGVRVRPEALGAILRVSAGELAGRALPIVDVAPAAASASPDVAHQITMFLARTRALAPVLDPLVSEAVEALARARGAGSEFVLATDLRFASRENAVLGQFEVGMGVVPGGAPTARLARLVGRGRALEILLVADDFDAPRAELYGYVNRAIADDRLDDEVDAMAARLARFDHDAISRTTSYVDQVTLPAESELTGPIADFRELFTRPAQQEQWVRLQALGLNTDSELERSLGRRVVESIA